MLLVGCGKVCLWVKKVQPADEADFSSLLDDTMFLISPTRKSRRRILRALAGENI